MSYSTHDTEWAVSTRGNLWRRKNGVLMSVGKRQSDGRFWVRVGGDFLKGSFTTEAAAKQAAENGIAGDEPDWDLRNEWEV